MKVFLTGASGFIGAGVARGLLAAGHDIIALARSPASADRLRRHGIEPFFGDLADADRLHAGTTRADAVIHAGFPRQAYQDIDRAIVVDQGAVAAFVHALAGTSKRLIYTSGIGVVGDTDGASVTEDSPLHTPPALTWRRDLEVTVIAAGGVVLRPAFVYGRAGGDILVTLIRDAAARGAAYYAAPGDNVWPNVHVDDLGRAYALALEHATAGRVFNLAGDEATPRTVIEAIGRLIGAPERTISLPLAKAIDVVPYIGWLGGNIRVESNRARVELGWRPEGRGILDEIEHGSYVALLHAPDAPSTSDMRAGADRGCR